MASGVACADNVKEEFGLMKKTRKYKYMMFRISDDKKTIIIEEPECLDGKGKGKGGKGSKGSDNEDSPPTTRRSKHEEDKECWDKMVESLNPNEPRYIVYDIENTSKDGRDIAKLLFVSWCADDCQVKKRMLHAASEEYLKKTLNGILGTIIQAHDKGDLEYKDAIAIAITRD